MVGAPALRPLGPDALEPARDAIRLGVEVPVEAELDFAERGRPGRARSASTGTGAETASGASTAFAASSTRALLRQLVRSEYCAHGDVRREGRREAAEIAGARSAPAVDRLVRIADRHDRRTAEQRREQVGLHDRGVLILIEQHHAEPLAHLVGDGRMTLDDLECARDLVREVDHADAALLGRVFAGEVGEQRERADLLFSRRHIGVDDGRPARRGPLEHIAEPLGERGERVEGHEVVDAVARDPQRGVDDAAHRLASRLEPRVVRCEHDPAHEQPRRRLREDGGFGIPSDPQRVLADDLVGEAVVGRHRRPVQQGVIVRVAWHRARQRHQGVHRRMASLGSAAGALEFGEDLEVPLRVQLRQVRHEPARLELGESLQPSLDPLGELAGGLPGEGEAQHLVAPHDPVRDEPHHARRHRLGLAAAGAGDHQRGLERGLDDGALLLRRRELAERGGDDVRRQRGGREGCRHDALTAPTVWMRQRP